METLTEEEYRRRQAEALMRQYGDPNASEGAQAVLARRAAQPRTFHNGGHWAGTDTPISDQDLAAGYKTASDRDVLGDGNYGYRGWSKRHPLGVMALFTAAAFGGGALAGAGAGGGAAGAGGAAGGGATAAGGGGAAAGAGGSGFSWAKLAPLAANMMSNNQQSAPNYGPPPSYQPAQFKDTFMESQQEDKKRRRLSAALNRGGARGYV